MPLKSLEIGCLHCRAMQLLEPVQIVNRGNAGGQRMGGGRPKANLQHVENIFNGAVSAPLLNALLNTLLGEVLGKG